MTNYDMIVSDSCLDVYKRQEEFSTALAAKQVYLMRGKYKAYLFERLENHGTIETKDVYTHCLLYTSIARNMITAQAEEYAHDNRCD